MITNIIDPTIDIISQLFQILFVKSLDPLISTYDKIQCTHYSNINLERIYSYNKSLFVNAKFPHYITFDNEQFTCFIIFSFLYLFYGENVLINDSRELYLAYTPFIEAYYTSQNAFLGNIIEFFENVIRHFFFSV